MDFFLGMLPDFVQKKTVNNAPPTALDLNLTRAHNKEPGAAYQVALLYLNDSDNHKAREWLEKAIVEESPEPDAYFQLSILYEAGEGGRQDIAFSKQLCLQAFCMQHGLAKMRLEALCGDDEKACLPFWETLMKACGQTWARESYQKTLSIWRTPTTITQQYVEICCDAGVSYERNNFPDSLMKAAECYIRALCVNNTYKPALTYLENVLCKVRFHPSLLIEALKPFYTKSDIGEDTALKTMPYLLIGNQAAMFFHDIKEISETFLDKAKACHMGSWNTPPNKEEAARLYSIAILLGYTSIYQGEVLQLLKTVFDSPVPVGALNYWIDFNQSVAHLGSSEAMCILGEIYCAQKDYKEAAVCFMQALCMSQLVVNTHATFHNYLLACLKNNAFTIPHFEAALHDLIDVPSAENNTHLFMKVEKKVLCQSMDGVVADLLMHVVMIDKHVLEEDDEETLFMRTLYDELGVSSSENSIEETNQKNIKYCTLASLLGSPIGYFKIAQWYAKMGDHEKAHLYYKKNVALAHAPSIAALAKQYGKGEGTNVNKVNAITHFFHALTLANEPHIRSLFITFLKEVPIEEEVWNEVQNRIVEIDIIQDTSVISALSDVIEACMTIAHENRKLVFEKVLMSLKPLEGLKKAPGEATFAHTLAPLVPDTIRVAKDPREKEEHFL